MKVVVCGDTADASHNAPLAMDCDVLVHEATNAFLSGNFYSKISSRLSGNFLLFRHGALFLVLQDPAKHLISEPSGCN